MQVGRSGDGWRRSRTPLPGGMMSFRQNLESRVWRCPCEEACVGTLGVQSGAVSCERRSRGRALKRAC
eukprot:4546233-Alexandrium_andersonii.AAC.1